METDPQIGPDPSPQETPHNTRQSGGTSYRTGCLIAVVVLLALPLMFVVAVDRNWFGLKDKAESMVNDITAFSPAEEHEMAQEVNRLTKAIGESRLSLDEFSTVIVQITTLIISDEYLDKANLDDDEKIQGRWIVHRFLRGMIDEKINEQQLDAVMVHIADRQPGGNWELRRHVSDENLRSFLVAAKEAADKAEIPEEPEAVDPSDELKKMIDAALNEP